MYHPVPIPIPIKSEVKSEQVENPVNDETNEREDVISNIHDKEKDAEEISDEEILPIFVKEEMDLDDNVHQRRTLDNRNLVLLSKVK